MTFLSVLSNSAGEVFLLIILLLFLICSQSLNPLPSLKKHQCVTENSSSWCEISF